MNVISKAWKAGAVAVLVAAAVSGSAMGASAATTVGPADPNQVRSPGQTGTLYTPTVVSSTAAGTNDGAKLDFFAPQGSTFPSADVTYFKRDGSGAVVSTGKAANCTLVSSTQISCDWTTVRLTIPAAAANATSAPDQYYTVPIQVNADAPFNTRFDGRMVVTRTGTDAPTALSVTSGEGTFGFSTPAQADSPVIDPMVGGGVAAAGVLALGTLGFAATRRKRSVESAGV
ncbi:hypothetical protein [Microbacterium sp. RURRCA19A]|uniref:hypothetical protein n=1 Tax=Microbacterium sp. RURRCA19A TaxID=1907391 RepID=UPI000954588D|nr:hypothetical protein [Microbacterium sp. RURRCA19A]SIR93886.1 hypothetical protein SAMN05880568_1918 [Microbacterium sp. RURRCA19A]